MATISSPGIGSGLDVASIVAKLVAAERAPEATQIANATSRYTAQLSALGTLKGALSTFQDKVKALSSSSGLTSFKASSSLSSIFSASAASTAVAGSYQVEVVSLATADKLASDPYSGGASTVLGNGNVQIDVGGKSFTVTLSSGGNTLGDLRDAINSASDNAGVSATLVNETNGTRLLLTANQTGVSNQVTVTTSLSNFTELQPAADAHIRVDNYDIYSSKNTLSNAIDGVTINLLDASPGNAGVLTISQDVSKGKSAIEAFVGAFNSVVGTVKSLTAYDPTSKTASPFTGDSAVRGAMQTLTNIVSGIADGGGFTTLSQLGITIQKDGTLKVDASKLSDALGNDPAAVSSLLTRSNGIASQLSTALDGFLGTNGIFTSKTDNLNARLKDLTNQNDALNRRMGQYQARLQAQYSALDALIAQMNATSSALAQQLASLPKLG